MQNIEFKHHKGHGTALQIRSILQYIFEGLGPLIANILMSSVVHIRRINENGIKKMCRNIFSVQQQLTNITMTRELALDQARQYYEMLYHTQDVSIGKDTTGREKVP